MDEAIGLTELADYYRMQGAPGDQQMLIALLKEAQEADGGVLNMRTIMEISQIYNIKENVLMALIRRVSTLRCEDIPHRLEMCGTCRCNGEIRKFIEDELGLKSGDVSKAYGFQFRTVGCMKNCKNGPSIKWDGVLYSNSSVELLKELFSSK